MSEKATKVKTIIANRVGVSIGSIFDYQDFKIDLGIDPDDSLMLAEFKKEWDDFSEIGYEAAKPKTVGEAVSYIENNTK